MMESPEADFVEKPIENQRKCMKPERDRQIPISLKNQWKINEIT
jgi:hypothetical protein